MDNLGEFGAAQTSNPEFTLPRGHLVVSGDTLGA